MSGYWLPIVMAVLSLYALAVAVALRRKVLTKATGSKLNSVFALAMLAALAVYAWQSHDKAGRVARAQAHLQSVISRSDAQKVRSDTLSRRSPTPRCRLTRSRTRAAGSGSRAS